MDDELELLRLSAFYAPYPQDRAKALLDLAIRTPDQEDWKIFLQNELRSQKNSSFLENYLERITLFPGSGIFVLPELLNLSNHTEYYVRGKALDVLGHLVFWSGHQVSYDQWHPFLIARLNDEYGDIAESAKVILTKIEQSIQTKMKKPRKRNSE